VGETVAAVEAAEAAAHAEDGAVRGVLERIHADETRHATLAWRFIQWALVSPSPALRRAARAELEALVVEVSRTVEPPPPPPHALGDLRYGIVSDAVRAGLRARVLRDIVGPCARALLDAAREGATDPVATPAVTSTDFGLHAGMVEHF
jgi:hypothetical protein